MHVLTLAAHDPIEHVLPHSFFEIFPWNLNFGAESIPGLGFPLSSEFWFTNQLLMTLVAAGLCLLIFPRLARSYVSLGVEPVRPRGRFMNLFESLLLFIREEVARPALKHRTDQFMPFLWTMFFFILFCNLLGLIPLGEIIQVLSGGHVRHIGGTATGNLAVTGGLALCALMMFHVSGVREVYGGLVTGTYGQHGDEGKHAEHAQKLPGLMAAVLALPLYLWNFAPHVFAQHGPRPKPGTGMRLAMVVVFAALVGVEHMGIFQLIGGSATAGTIGLWFGIVVGVMAGLAGGGLHWTDLVDLLMWGFLLLLEMIGAVVKPFALMIRLFANMVAGHIVLAAILALIFAAKTVAMGYMIGVISSLGALAINGLELLVACLQAYIFVFLTSLFLGMAVEPEH